MRPMRYWLRRGRLVLRLRPWLNWPDAANRPSIDGGLPGLRCYWKSTNRWFNTNWLRAKERIWRRVWRLWRKESLGSLYRLILSEMIIDEEGVRYLREVFFPRRQAFIAIAFQTAKDRGEIPQDADIKFLMDLLFGYSLFHMITHQIDDDELPDRISAAIANLARIGVPTKGSKF